MARRRRAAGWKTNECRRGLDGGTRLAEGVSAGTEGRRKRERREPDACGDKDRPSISNWPEADKVRHLSLPEGDLPWAHDPTGRHNATPAWPRAGFGLPIVGQFQMLSREKGIRWDKLSKPRTEPRDACQSPNSLRKEYGFRRHWRSVHGEHDRLASSLINSSSSDCMLWSSAGKMSCPPCATMARRSARPKRS